MSSISGGIRITPPSTFTSGHQRPVSLISTYSSSFDEEDDENRPSWSPVTLRHRPGSDYYDSSRYQSYTSLTSSTFSTTPRRMTNTVRSSNRSAILAVGEELRQLLHAEDPPVLKDRRYHLKTYSTCFVGHEMVDWLLRKGEVESRAEAVAMMQKLLENDVIHHVCDDHNFKDEKLFFRFRRDDNTYEEPPDALIVAKGQRIYSRLRTDGSNLIQDRKYHLLAFKQCFIGRELVDWLITRGEVKSREEAVTLGRQFVDAGIFRHVCDDHHFKDEYLFFRFKNDEPRQKTFGKRVGVSKQGTRGKRGGSVLSDNSTSEYRNSDASHTSSTSEHYVYNTGTPPENEDDYIHMQSATEDTEPGYIKMHQPSPEPITTSSSTTPPTTTPTQPDTPPKLTSQTSLSDISLDEITDPNGRFTKRSINVTSDAVGYGFVIRGSRPVYVHTVDPNGPAAAVGLLVGEYLYSVNGQLVMEKSHTDVARIILMGSSTAYLVTYVERDRIQAAD